MCDIGIFRRGCVLGLLGPLVFFFIATSAPVFAQRNANAAPAKTGESRIALVVGNSSYKDSPLKNPLNDATDMASALRSLGFQVTLRTNANQKQMKQALREFGQALKRSDVGLFYFAGHGVQSRGKNFLIPIGASVESEAELEDEALDANLVLNYMQEAENRVNIVVLDACRNNPFARNFRSASRGLAQMEAATGSFVAFATAPGSVAADGEGRNGVYTQHLLESLKQPDSDIDKVFRRVTSEVSRTTNGKQVPWISSSLTNDFRFRPQVASAAPVAAVVPAQEADKSAVPVSVDLAYWESIKDTKNPDELKAYLEQYPNGRFAPLARARLKALGSAPATRTAPAAQVASTAPVAVAAPAKSAEPAPVTAAPPVPAARIASVAPSVQAIMPRIIDGDIQNLATGNVFRDCADCPELVVIPQGGYAMNGSRRIDIGYKLAVGKTEVTFAQWDACVADGGCGGYKPNDNRWGRGDQPVVNVSWNDTRLYLAWLSKKTGKSYRLLTDSEWEYAARAGTTTAYYWGDSDAGICRYAVIGKQFWQKNTGDCGPAKPEPVGKKLPNAFGLYDMLGNLWEWVEDCHDNIETIPVDGSALAVEGCSSRVQRGGAWDNRPKHLVSSSRDRSGVTSRNTNLGFRVARTN